MRTSAAVNEGTDHVLPRGMGLFASGPVSEDFVTELRKVLRIGPSTITRRAVLNELLRIENGTYDGLGTNKSSIDIIDTDHIVIEVIIVRRADEEAKTIMQSVAYETCLMPVFGSMDVFEYKRDELGSIVGDESLVTEVAPNVILLAKTSECPALYRLVPSSEICILVSSTWKVDPDDYYVSYDRATREWIEAVSTSSRESRVQFWLTFSEALRQSLSTDLIHSLQAQAETRKLRHFLDEMLAPVAAHA